MVKTLRCFAFNVAGVWIPLAVAVVCLTGLVYLTAQQVNRIGANDPQIQIAEDAAAKLAKGAKPQSVVEGPIVDVASSLAPYIVIYNTDEEPVASSALLDDEIPTLPDGVLAYTKAHVEDRITWQPRSGIRSAIVIKYYSGKKSGFVMAGRSLREVEKRANALLLIAAAACLVTLFVTLAAVAILELVKTRLAKISSQN